MSRDATKMHLIRIAWSVGIALFVVACAGQFQQQEQALQQPIRINCATAEGDIRMLQHEKAHVAQQIAMGVTAISPAGMLVGRDHRDRANQSAGGHRRLQQDDRPEDR